MSRAPRQSSPGEAKNPTDSVTFEAALAELEKLVGLMEGGDLSLEHSLAAHKRGLELARYCQEKLESARQQVRVLEGEALKALQLLEATQAADDSDD